MTLFSHCPVCKVKRLYIAKRSYTVPDVSPLPITSVNEICTYCFQELKFLTLGTMSLRHWVKFIKIKIISSWNFLIRKN